MAIEMLVLWTVTAQIEKSKSLRDGFHCCWNSQQGEFPIRITPKQTGSNKDSNSTSPTRKGILVSQLAVL